jgi:hypothetical protein
VSASARHQQLLKVTISCSQKDELPLGKRVSLTKYGIFAASKAVLFVQKIAFVLAPDICSMIKLGAYVRGLRSALGRLSRSVRLSNGPYGGQGVFSSTQPASPEHAKIKESIMPAAVDPVSTGHNSVVGFYDRVRIAQ